MAYGKSIGLFLVNGTADSLVTAELSNWNGKVLVSFDTAIKTFLMPSAFEVGHLKVTEW